MWTAKENYFVAILVLVSIGALNFPTIVCAQDLIFEEHEMTQNGWQNIFAKTQTTTTTTPNPPNCESLCITLDFCPDLFVLLQDPTPKNLQILKNASCGFTPEGDPLVLCQDFLCDRRNLTKQTTMTIRKSAQLNATPAMTATAETPEISASAPLAAIPVGVENNLLRIRTFKNPLDNNEDCGISFPSRINGGTTASPGEFPWIVGIAHHTQTGPQIICGGALVTDEFVLTAAHCVVDAGHHVRNISHIRIGAFNISNPNEEGAENIEVDKVLFHDKFRERPVVKHDIALLKLKTKVTPGLNIGTICLPNATSDAAAAVYYDPNSKTTIAGWGGDGSQGGYTTLQKVEIPLVPGDECKKQFYRVRVRVLPDLQVCAGATGKDSCKGDSGGPLMVTINGRAVIVGIISYGTVQCDGRLPGVYTKVTSYMDWIRDTVIKNS